MKDLAEKFAEVEKRVKSIVTENRELKGRLTELEQELTQVRSEAQDFEHFHGKQLHIREKIERILHSLEAVTNKE